MFLGNVVKYPSHTKNGVMLDDDRNILVVSMPKAILNYENSSNRFKKVFVAVPWDGQEINIKLGWIYGEDTSNTFNDSVLIAFTPFLFRRGNGPIAYKSDLATGDFQRYFLWIDRYDRAFLEIFDTFLSRKYGYITQDLGV